MRKHDEKGAALILALVFTLVVSVGVAVLMDFVDTSFRLSTQVRNLRGQDYAVDGAVDIAVTHLRAPATLTETSLTTCAGLVIPTVNDQSITVSSAYVPDPQPFNLMTWGVGRTRTVSITVSRSGIPITDATVRFVDTPILGAQALVTSRARIT